MEHKKLADTYKKRVVVNMSDYEYGEFLSNLKYENINHPAKVVRFFVEAYLSGDENARGIIESYKQKNKVAGRAKKDYIIKQETLAKKNETLYSLNEEDIDGIYDILDETLPD